MNKIKYCIISATLGSFMIASVASAAIPHYAISKPGEIMLAYGDSGAPGSNSPKSSSGTGEPPFDWRNGTGVSFEAPAPPISSSDRDYNGYHGTVEKSAYYYGDDVRKSPKPLPKPMPEVLPAPEKNISEADLVQKMGWGNTKEKARKAAEEANRKAKEKAREVLDRVSGNNDSKIMA